MNAYTGSRSFSHLNRFRISRRGRKLQISDDQRVVIALPKDIPERTWADILQKEENELVCLDIREEILEEALRIGYDNYMEKQKAFFVVHCAAEAWLKLINWHFYCHDPGEDPSAHPPCYIPKRVESWIPDEPPLPSPGDTWSRTPLNKVEECVYEDSVKEIISSDSVEVSVADEIPEKFWFPAKVNLKTYYEGKNGMMRRQTLRTDQDGNRLPPLIEEVDENGMWHSILEDTPSPEAQMTPDLDFNTDSEVLQKVTDYSTEELINKVSSDSVHKPSSPVDGSLHGAGDSTVAMEKSKRRISGKGRFASRTCMSRAFVPGKSKGALPPLDTDSSISVISDCRLRNLRLDTQFEVSMERIESPYGDGTKRK